MKHTIATTVFFGFQAISVLAQGSNTHEPDTDPSCNKWIKGVTGNDCNTLADMSGVDLIDLLQWNPALSRDCKAIKNGYSYCVGVGDSPPTPPTVIPTPTPPPKDKIPPVVTQKPAGVAAGQPWTCNQWYQVRNGDTCTTIDKAFSPDKNWRINHFLSWNPALGPDCAGLRTSDWLCVNAATIPTATGTFTPPATPPPTTPTPVSPVVTSRPDSAKLDGQPWQCSAWYKVASRDTCNSIVNTVASAAGTSIQHLLAWNPTIGPDCAGLTVGTFLCVKAPAPPTKG